MSDGEREIILTLQKIFNWQFPPQSTQLTLAFHSLKTSALILQRTLTATPANAQLTLRYSLKITYLPEENEVVLKLTHLAGRNGSVALAEIAINLDSLTSRKVQFFPLGSNDKVLKIIVGQSQQSPRCPLHGFTRVSSNENQTFLKEKQDFLQRVMKGVSTSSFKNVQSRSQKKSFSQRAKELLGEVQGMKGESQRGRKREEGKGIEQEFNDYYYQNPAAYHTQQELMITSKHQASKLTFTRSESEHRLNPRSKLMGRENDSQRSSNKSQKHRLKLNNLEMVAVENQYYDELPEVRKLKRRSELFQQNYYYSKQKLQRHSQYY